MDGGRAPRLRQGTYYQSVFGIFVRKISVCPYIEDGYENIRQVTNDKLHLSTFKTIQMMVLQRHPQKQMAGGQALR